VVVTRSRVTECWAVEAALPLNWQPKPHEEGDLSAGPILLELWAFYRTPAEAARRWCGDLGWLKLSRGDLDLEKICIQLLALLDVLWRTHCRKRAHETVSGLGSGWGMELEDQ